MTERAWKGVGPSFARSRNLQSTCPTCNNLAPVHNSKDNSIVKIDFLALVDSADEGYCRLCTLVHRALMKLGAELPPSQIYTASHVEIIASSGAPWYAQLQLPRKPRLAAEIYQPTGSSGLGVSGLGHATDLSENINSPTVFNLIRDWVRTCDRTHSQCSTRPSNSPSRLLHLGDPTLPLEAREYRLVQEFEPVNYIALSHCWGPEQNLITTKKSLPSKFTSIAWTALPRSYQDTITICHYLEIQYLWVDSLCIVQDSQSDWETESAKMTEIYEDSYLTVAVALASGDEIGFLHSDPARGKYLSASVDLVDLGITPDQVKVRSIHDQRTLDVQQPLATRAWTLQESMIAPRLLTFSLAVTFECRDSSFCECGSGLLPDPFCADSRTFKQASRSEYAVFLEKVDDANKIYDYWAFGIVTPYSGRKITQRGDRLPALSALAKKFAERLDDDYLAGLWRRDFLFGANWEADRLLQNSTDRAPSWSWASVEGAVSFGTRSPDASGTWTILEAEIQSVRGGLVQRGLLRVAGWTCWAQLQIEWRNDPWKHPHFDCEYTLTRHGRGDEKHQIIYDDPNVGPALKLDTPISSATILPSKGQRFEMVQRSNIAPAAHRAPVSGWVLCLLLYDTLSSRTSRKPERRFILLGASPKRSDTYRRVGVLTIGEKEPAWLEQLEKKTVSIE